MGLSGFKKIVLKCTSPSVTLQKYVPLFSLCFFIMSMSKVACRRFYIEQTWFLHRCVRVFVTLLSWTVSTISRETDVNLFHLYPQLVWIISSEASLFIISYLLYNHFNCQWIKNVLGVNVSLVPSDLHQPFQGRLHYLLCREGQQKL